MVSITVLLLLLLLLHVLVPEPLPLLSELRPFGTVGLSVNFSLLGTIPFTALCPLGPSALQGPLSFEVLCPSWLYVNVSSLPLGDLCSSGFFTFWVI